MRSIALEDNSAFVKLSPDDKQKVIDFISEQLLVREDDLVDQTPEVDVEDNGSLTIYSGDVVNYVDTEFICYRCTFKPDGLKVCNWRSGDNPSYLDHDTEMLDHVMWHLGLLPEEGNNG